MYPVFEDVIGGKDKNRLLEVRRSPRSLFPLILIFIASIIALYLLTSFIQSPNVQKSLPFLKNFSTRLFGVIPLIVLLEILRQYHNDLYLFSIHRLTHFKGRLSFAYQVPVIKYIDMRAVNVSQGFWGRLLGYGDVAIGTSGHDGNELTLIGVAEPEQLALLLDKLRTHSLQVASEEINVSVDSSHND